LQHAFLDAIELPLVRDVVFFPHAVGDV
jgi:hypothetical protein